jgi:hypothetical protein
MPLLFLLFRLLPVFAGQLIEYTNPQGQEIWLDDDRQPALYTGDFGDCLGQSMSAITVTRFDASLYMDNMTVAFHIGGNTNLTGEPVMGGIAIRCVSCTSNVASVHFCFCIWRDAV